MKEKIRGATAFIVPCFLWMECEQLPHAPLRCCTELQNYEPQESLSPCSGFLSNAVINMVIKCSLGRKRFVWLTLAGPLLREVRAGAPAGADANTFQECSLLTYSQACIQLAAHSVLGPPASIFCEDNDHRPV